MSEMDEVIQDFLVESYEALEQIDQELIILEEDPDSSESLASIFRGVHTIKGTCGFLRNPFGTRLVTRLGSH